MKKRIKGLFSDREFYNNLFVIALPIIIQNFIGCFLNMLDTVMVGRLGEAEIASVGIANQYFTLFNLLVLGTYSGCGIFISQFWGDKAIKNIKKVLGVELFSGIIISIVFMLGGIMIPHKIISIFNTDSKVVLLGSKYLKITCLSYIFTSITFAYGMAARCIEKSIIPMIVSAIALAINTVMNYILIFGKLGIRPMGVEGAALATLIARVIEMIIMIGYIYRIESPLNAKIKELIDINLDFIKKVYKTVIPVILNEACWGLGAVVYSVVYGRIGTKAIASIQICSTIQNIFMVITFGLASASAVMIGNKIGAGEEETGKIYANRFCILGFITGIILALILAASAPSITSFFNVSQEVLHDTLMILYITSCILVVRVFNIIVIVGVLRGGGDARYSLMAEGFTMWCIGVPLSFMGAFWFKLPVYWVVALTTIEEMVKCILCITRLKSNKWVNNVICNISA